MKYTLIYEQDPTETGGEIVRDRAWKTNESFLRISVVGNTDDGWTFYQVMHTHEPEPGRRHIETNHTHYQILAEAIAVYDAMATRPESIELSFIL